MADINELFVGALQARLADPATQDKINAAVDRVIDSSIEDILSRHGEFGQRMRELVKQSLVPTIDVDDFPRYNNYVCQRIKARMDQFHNEKLSSAIDMELDHIVGEIPTDVNLSWVIQKYKEHIKQEIRDFDRQHVGHIFLTIEREYSSFTKITISAPSGQYPKLNMGLYHQDSNNRSVGKVYIAELDDRDIRTGKHDHGYHGFGQLAKNMLFMSSILTMDKGHDSDSYDLEMDCDEEEQDD